MKSIAVFRLCVAVALLLLAGRAAAECILPYDTIELSAGGSFVFQGNLTTGFDYQGFSCRTRIVAPEGKVVTLRFLSVSILDNTDRIVFYNADENWQTTYLNEISSSHDTDPSVRTLWLAGRYAVIEFTSTFPALPRPGNLNYWIASSGNPAPAPFGGPPVVVVSGSSLSFNVNSEALPSNALLFAPISTYVPARLKVTSLGLAQSEVLGLGYGANVDSNTALPFLLDLSSYTTRTLILPTEAAFPRAPGVLSFGIMPLGCPDGFGAAVSVDRNQEISFTFDGSIAAPSLSCSKEFRAPAGDALLLSFNGTSFGSYNAFLSVSVGERALIKITNEQSVSAGTLLVPSGAANVTFYTGYYPEQMREVALSARAAARPSLPIEVELQYGAPVNLSLVTSSALPSGPLAVPIWISAPTGASVQIFSPDASGLESDDLISFRGGWGVDDGEAFSIHSSISAPVEGLVRSDRIALLLLRGSASGLLSWPTLTLSAIEPTCDSNINGLFSVENATSFYYSSSNIFRGLTCSATLVAPEGQVVSLQVSSIYLDGGRTLRIIDGDSSSSRVLVSVSGYGPSFPAPLVSTGRVMTLQLVSGSAPLYGPSASLTASSMDPPGAIFGTEIQLEPNLPRTISVSPGDNVTGISTPVWVTAPPGYVVRATPSQLPSDSSVSLAFIEDGVRIASFEGYQTPTAVLGITGLLGVLFTFSMSTPLSAQVDVRLSAVMPGNASRCPGDLALDLPPLADGEIRNISFPLEDLTSATCMVKFASAIPGRTLRFSVPRLEVFSSNDAFIVRDPSTYDPILAFGRDSPVPANVLLPGGEFVLQLYSTAFSSRSGLAEITVQSLPLILPSPFDSIVQFNVTVPVGGFIDSSTVPTPLVLVSSFRGSPKPLVAAVEEAVFLSTGQYQYEDGIYSFNYGPPALPSTLNVYSILGSIGYGVGQLTGIVSRGSVSTSASAGTILLVLRAPAPRFRLAVSSCLPGTYVSGYYCNSCPGGTVSTEYGAEACSPCPGNSVPNGDRSSCVQCPPGQYGQNGYCTSCPSGLVLGPDGTCGSCPLGSFALDGSPICTACAAGTFGIPSNCTYCSAGEVCSLCPAGTASSIAGATNSSVCQPCTPGTVAPPGSPSCQPCPAGTFWNQSICSPCPAGTFSSEAGALQCQACAGGVNSGVVGASNASQCRVWSPRMGAALAALSDGTLLLAGGQTSRSDEDSVAEVWSSSNRGSSWKLLASSAPFGHRTFASLVPFPDGTAVLLGGSSSPLVWTARSQGHQWTLATAAPVFGPIVGQCAARVPTLGVLLVVGGSPGWNGSSDPIAGSAVWSSADKGVSWTEKSTAPWPARSFAACSSTGSNEMFVAGGVNTDARIVFGDMWRSPNGGDTWVPVAAPVGWRKRGVFASVPNVPGGGAIILGGLDLNVDGSGSDMGPDSGSGFNGMLGGGTGSGAGLGSGDFSPFVTVLSDGWRSDAALSAWQSIQTPASIPRGGFGATRLPSGEVVIAGGATPELVQDIWLSSSNGDSWSVAMCPPGHRCDNSSVIVPCEAGTFAGQVDSTQCTACPAGKYSSRGASRCVDCEAGTFSSQGAAWCTPCPERTYSARGSSSCSACPGGKGQGSVGLVTAAECVIFSPRQRFAFSANSATKEIIAVSSAESSSFAPEVWASPDGGFSWMKRQRPPFGANTMVQSLVWTPRNGVMLIGMEYGPWGPAPVAWRTVDEGRSWTRAASNGTWSARVGSCAVALPNGDVLVMGGYGSTDSFFPTSDVYKTADGGESWSILASAQWSPRYGHKCAVTNGTIFVVGGSSQFDNGPVWKSLDWGLSWQPVSGSNVGYSVYDFSNLATPAFGGIAALSTKYYQQRTAIILFSQDGQQWEEVGSAPMIPRSGAFLQAFADGSAVVVGGISDGSTLLADVWSFHPESQEWSAVICGPGNVCPDVSTQRPCPRGSASRHPNATDFDACSMCPAGTVSSAGSSVCVRCAPGTYMPNPGGTSWYSDGGEFSSSCWPCPSGHVSNPGATSCNECPAGSFKSDPHRCSPCPAGTFNSSSGAEGIESCTPCPAGFVSGEGSTSCACQPGSYSPDGQSCQQCPAGKYSAAVGATSCMSCPAGKYSAVVGAASESTCTACPAGKYSAVVGAASESTCMSCPAGKYSAVVGAASESTCAACPAGTFALASAVACTNCTPGFFNPAPQAASCSRCPRNSISSTRASACVECGLNFVSMDGVACMCRAGYVSIGTGACALPCELPATYDAARDRCVSPGGTQPQCQPGSSYDSATKSCVCNTGFEAVGGVCVPACVAPRARSILTGLCECGEGFISDGATCLRPPESSVPVQALSGSEPSAAVAMQVQSNASSAAEFISSQWPAMRGFLLEQALAAIRAQVDRIILNSVIVRSVQSRRRLLSTSVVDVDFTVVFTPTSAPAQLDALSTAVESQLQDSTVSSSLAQTVPGVQVTSVSASAQVPVCSNGVRDPTETDVDCGGVACAACALGRSCSRSQDCAGSLECRSNVCSIAPSSISIAKIAAGVIIAIIAGGLVCLSLAVYGVYWCTCRKAAMAKTPGPTPQSKVAFTTQNVMFRAHDLEMSQSRVTPHQKSSV